MAFLILKQVETLFNSGSLVGLNRPGASLGILAQAIPFPATSHVEMIEDVALQVLHLRPAPVNAVDLNDLATSIKFRRYQAKTPFENLYWLPHQVSSSKILLKPPPPSLAASLGDASWPTMVKERSPADAGKKALGLALPSPL